MLPASAAAATNPSYAQISAWLESAAAKHDLPPQLLKAIAWRESSWRQYDSSGQPLISFDGGIGIMQLTNKPQFDQHRLKYDPAYNIDAGAQVLAAAWNWSNQQNRLVGLPNDDKDLLENWYYPTAKYNGWNNPSYPAAVRNTMASPPSVIAAYLKPVRPTLPGEVIPGFAFGNYATAFKAGEYRWYHSNGSLRGTYKCAVHNWRTPTPPPPTLPPAGGEWISSAVVKGNAPGSWATGTQGWTAVKFTVTTGPWQVNVRSGPGTSYAKVRTLPANTTVTCYGWRHGETVTDEWLGTPDARWYRIDDPAPAPAPVGPKLSLVGSVSYPAGPHTMGDDVEATYTVKNSGDQTGTWDSITLAMRGPDGENKDFGGGSAITLAADQSRTFTVARTVDAPGPWEGWVASNRGGTWETHGPKPSVQFSVVQAPAPAPKTVIRLAGDDRYGTSIAVSGKAHPAGAQAVVIATGANFPDALCAAPLAKAYAGPVLLTPPASLTPELIDELERLAPRTVFIVGSSRAVSSNVADQLLALPSQPSVTRLGGSDRYETSARIATQLNAKLGATDTAVIATGLNFPDALSAAPLAAAKGWPILLTQPSALSEPTARALDTLGVKSTLVVGSESVVSSAVVSKLPSPTRKGGVDRYETCAAVADYATSHGMSCAYVALGTGQNFPDVLSAGPMVGTEGGVLMLTSKHSLPDDIASWLSDNRDSVLEVDVLGGTAAVSQSCLDQIRGVLAE